MALPNTKVEIAFNAGYTTPAASRTWTDVSTYVEAQSSLTIRRGRQDEISQVQPSTMTVTLDNTDGRFTPEKTGGAYYPNVKKGRPIRVTSTYNAVQYVRFVGYINEWPVVWPDSTSATSTVTITASSRMARMGVGATLQSTPGEEILSDSPAAYYPLGDPSGSTAAADVSANQAPPLTMVGTGAPVTFGDPGPTPGLSAATFTEGGMWLGTTMLNVTSTPGYIFAFAVSNPTLVLERYLLFPPVVKMYAGALQVDGTPVGSGVYDDGDWHVIAVRHTSLNLADIYIDGVLTDSSVVVPTASTGSAFTVGGVTSGATVFPGSIAHVALFSSAPSGARLIAQSEAILTNFAGDLSGTRVGRYATMAGISSAEQLIDAGVATIGAVDSVGQTSISLIQKVAETENGTAYDAKDSVGSLVFKGRDARYNAVSSFTLNVTAQEVQGDLLPVLGDQFLVNDVTAAGAGTSIRIVDTTSADDYGFYRASLDLVTENADDIAAIAQWRVGLGKEPTTRYATVTADIVNLSAAQAALALAADIGTRFGLSNLPSQAPASTADFFVEGTAEVITEKVHMLTFNTSPTTGYAGAAGVWQLDVNNIDGPYILAL